ncbi:zinc finger BED domain-containing protein RICESLEEPER 2-like [Mercurialis annua]|uniref:zinc finger BED domain-containing protein RICESLEEPER 2-like n=1 Tax=Mercurialis annua TaxID=3986 RepID=UPI0024ADCEBB|nr:zinc finger BED domain-containing protein RICESLEEPER 2-like [Mercurialis annua]
MIDLLLNANLLMSNLDQRQVAGVGVEGVVGSFPELPPSTQQQQPVAAGEGSSEPSQQQQEGAAADATGAKPVDKKRKQVSVRSKVWDHFERIVDDNGKLILSKCLYCAKTYNSDTKINGTSTLRSHILSCFKNPHSKDTRQALLTLQPVDACPNENEGKGQLGTWKFNQEDIRKALSYMLIIDELPFRFVEGMGFKKLMSVACPRFHIPSRWTVNRDCYQMFLDERLNLKNTLRSGSQRVSITTDTWTSIQRVNYMCVTCHWIDNDWLLHKRIINLVPVCGHKGDYISKTLENCLLGWGLKNIFTVTMDNAGNNNTAIAAFKKKLMSWGTDVSRCEYLHMRCIAHVINLVVSDGLKEMSSSVKKVRDCVRYIRNSPSRLKKFKDLIADAKLGTKKSLCLDVATRWNSTYLMLDTACLFQSVFESYEASDENFRSDMIESIPNFFDWETVKKFATCLSYFYVTTLRISGSLYVTSNMHFQEICDLSIMLDEMLVNEDIEIVQMGRKMREKFNKYWGPKLFQTVNDKLTSLFVEYQKASVNATSSAYVSLSQSSEGVSAQTPVLPPPAKKHMSLMKAKFDIQNKGIESDSRKSELEVYLSEATVENDDAFNILKWWKLNSGRFPILSRMARDILVVPISTVASESAFSTSGRVLDCFRSSLTPRLVEALVCTQDWLRAESSPLVIEECLEELEPFEQGYSCRTKKLDSCCFLLLCGNLLPPLQNSDTYKALIYLHDEALSSTTSYNLKHNALTYLHDEALFCILNNLKGP